MKLLCFGQEKYIRIEQHRVKNRIFGLYCKPFYFSVRFIFANCEFAIGFAIISSTQKVRGMSAEHDEKRIFEIDPVDQKLWTKM